MKKSDDDSGKSKGKASCSGVNDEKGKQISGIPTEMDEDSASKKRKRDCNLEMLSWVHNVAKDPHNPVTGSLPESNEWNNYGTELQWKQVLASRQAMLSQTNVGASTQQSVWQRTRKIHPVMYDDQVVLRSSSRAATRASSSQSSGHRNNSFDRFSSTSKKRIRTGPDYQAELPDLVGNEHESDPKWLGTKLWPVSRNEPRNVIEQDPIGAGREESCGCQCQLRGSLECVGLHIRENRSKVKDELGSAFYNWRFDKMGEDAALTWTKTEETKFEDIVKSNRLSKGESFWTELFKAFPGKDREALVNYYFNRFLLQRRCNQNRDTAGKYGSDDDESEYGPVANRFGQRAPTKTS